MSDSDEEIVKIKCTRRARLLDSDEDDDKIENENESVGVNDLTSETSTKSQSKPRKVSDDNDGTSSSTSTGNCKSIKSKRLVKRRIKNVKLSHSNGDSSDDETTKASPPRSSLNHLDLTKSSPKSSQTSDNGKGCANGDDRVPSQLCKRRESNSDGGIASQKSKSSSSNSSDSSDGEKVSCPSKNKGSGSERSRSSRSSSNSSISSSDDDKGSRSSRKNHSGSEKSKSSRSSSSSSSSSSDDRSSKKNHSGSEKSKSSRSSSSSSSSSSDHDKASHASRSDCNSQQTPSNEPKASSTQTAKVRSPSADDSTDSDEAIIRVKNSKFLNDSDDSSLETEINTERKESTTCIQDNNTATKSSSQRKNCKRKHKRKPIESEDDSSNDADCKDSHSFVNDEENSIASDKNIEHNEQVKPKKYQLLDIDDISDADHDKPLENRNETSDDEIANLTETEKRKRKLRKLNEQKKSQLKKTEEKKKKEAQNLLDLDIENVSSTKKKRKKKKKGQDTETVNEDSNEDDLPPPKSKRKPRARTSKQGPDGEQKQKEPKKKSKKEDPMLEIKSVTQKMIREGRITLPYHQPKQRSLDEFLQRRSRIPTIPLKPSSRDLLTLVGERLLKKEAEVAEFYKSESEHSDNEFTNNNENTEQLQPEHKETDSTVASQSLDSMAGENAKSISTSACTDTMHTDAVNSSLEQNVNPCDENTEDCVKENDSLDANSETAVSGSSETCPVPVMDIDGKIPNEFDSCNRIIGKILEDEIESSSNCVTLMDSVSKGIESANIGTAEQQTEPAKQDITVAGAVDNQMPVNDSENIDSYVESDFSLRLQDTDDGTNSDNKKCDVQSLPDHCSSESLANSSPTATNILQPSQAERSTGNETSVIEKTVLEDALGDGGLEKEDSCLNQSESAYSHLAAEALRDQKLALLSRLNIELPSTAELKRDENTELQFEVTTSVRKSGILQLMEKFVQHNTEKKPVRKRDTKLNIVSTKTDSQGNIVDVVKETLSLTSGTDIDGDMEKKFTLPGSKYSYFKDAMLKTLVSKKEANWKEYQREKRKLYASDDSESENEEVETSRHKIDFEPYHPEDEPDDDELIEDDIPLEDDRTDKKRSEFLDEEADVSFDEEENVLGDDGEQREDSDDEHFGDLDENSEEEEKEEDNDAESQHKESNDENSRQCDEDSAQKDEALEKPAPSEKLFKNDITAIDLENKLLGLDSISTQNNPADDLTNTQIFSICSGRFPTQPIQPSTDDSESQFFMEDSQNFNLTTNDTNDDFATSHLKSAPIERYSLLQSDESDTEELFARKKMMRIEDSDEENELNKTSCLTEVANEDNSTEAINNESEVEDVEKESDVSEEELEDDNVDGEIGYNSEEELVSYKDTMKPTDYFEDEAELSESEWGSEDENEKGLDEFEKEVGDDDDIDSERLKEELGKIHMRQLLDDDQHDIRLLKEILLEDGELHSDTKRQRKFQWKDADGKDFFSKAFNDSDDENIQDDDNDVERDENWRKVRHEREMFLSQQEKNNELLMSGYDDHYTFSKIDAKATTKIIINSSNVAGPNAYQLTKSPTIKQPFDVPSKKCGSFLSRGKLLLNRIAGNTTESKENIAGAKNSRNFVFATISPEKKAVADSRGAPKTEKRKIPTKLAAMKKLKLSDDLTNTTGLLINKSGLLAQLALSD